MTTITDVDPPPSLEDLPDELLHGIIVSLDLYQRVRFPFLTARRESPWFVDRPFFRCPVDSMSLVNHRLRRLSLPILFKNICFELQLDAPYSIRDVDLEREVGHLMKALKCNAHLTPLIRNFSIVYFDSLGEHPTDRRKYCKDPETLLIIDVLSRCTNLEHLELPKHIVFGDIDNQNPIIEALNRHPSDKLRLIFRSMKERSLVSGPVHPDGFRPMPLSRVVCRCWDDRRPGQEMKTWLAQGLNIEKILRRYYDDSWMAYTYPGLTCIEDWEGNQRSLQSNIDFLQRHPLLKRIKLDPAHILENAPWGVAFAYRMHPYSCKIGRPPATVFKVDEEWLYESIRVSFQGDIPHGGVEIVESMVQKMGTMLPQSSTRPRVTAGIDFLSPVGEYMTSEDLIGILTRNLSHVRNLQFGTFLCDILTRECTQNLEPVFAIDAGFKSFRERLMQAMPMLDGVELYYEGF
ncbi:hypothetical protein K435DRAFT_856878 [Dendrothele bispora CBS 962.96]|uniref:Uncharacterized protein n=1 Tax=Dendrothele bispora (strain CBS 962.96) TaxID=1314807 RepID=A0A4S8M8R2_DENBC|nr:hypothetical protein K435DRAFT_856878 [Dendrothele bispora CBS 962.96]